MTFRKNISSPFVPASPFYLLSQADRGADHNFLAKSKTSNTGLLILQISLKDAQGI